MLHYILLKVGGILLFHLMSSQIGFKETNLKGLHGSSSQLQGREHGLFRQRMPQHPVQAEMSLPTQPTQATANSGSRLSLSHPVLPPAIFPPSDMDDVGANRRVSGSADPHSLRQGGRAASFMGSNSRLNSSLNVHGDSLGFVGSGSRAASAEPPQVEVRMPQQAQVNPELLKTMLTNPTVRQQMLRDPKIKSVFLEYVRNNLNVTQERFRNSS